MWFLPFMRFMRVWAIRSWQLVYAHTRVTPLARASLLAEVTTCTKKKLRIPVRIRPRGKYGKNGRACTAVNARHKPPRRAYVRLA